MAVSALLCWKLKVRGIFIANPAPKTTNEHKAKFTPNMENYQVSLSYEGLSLKKGHERKSITDQNASMRDKYGLEYDSYCYPGSAVNQPAGKILSCYNRLNAGSSK